MNFADLKENIVYRSIRFWEMAANKIVELDHTTFIGLVACGALVVLVLLCVLLISYILRNRAEAEEQAQENPGDIAVLIRDLSSRLSNYTTLTKEEHLYLKHELTELKAQFGQAERLGEIEDSLESLSARISSYANLIREEYSILKQELGEVRGVLGQTNARHVPEKKAVGQFEL